MAAKNPPWARRKRESGAAFAAFLKYRDMGLRRSLNALDRQCIDGIPSIAQIREWSATHDWVERCRLWDNHLQAQRDRELAKNAAKWERRRLAELEHNFTLGMKCSEIVDQALKFPLAKRTVERRTEDDGKTIVEITNIEPLGWNITSIMKVAEFAANIKAAVFAAVGKDTSAMSDEELEAVANAGLELGVTSGA